jgi:RNA recognition motif-containing protein
VAIKTLYVGNLPYNTTEEELRRVFAEWGPVQMIRLVSEKGFAFVDLPAEKLADALRGANGRDLNGRALRVDEARPRAARAGLPAGAESSSGRRVGLPRQRRRQR